MSSNDNGRLMATAAGAAAAGAVLAVAAMKLIGGNDSSPSSSSVIVAGRTKRSSYIMNEPDAHDSFNIDPSSQPSMVRTESKTLLFPHNHEEKMRRRIATRYTIEEENNMPRESVTVRVPATSANVGPGCTLHRIPSGYFASLRFGRDRSDNCFILGFR